jgi:hypothetical protein
MMISARAVRWIVGSGAVCLAVAAPVRWSPGRGFVEATACADGTCCPEPQSFCTVNGFVIFDYYLKAGGGPCRANPTQPLPPP